MVREYQTPKGEKVREIGPIVYGYSTTIGPDDKPHAREFDDVKSFNSVGMRERVNASKPQISTESEPLEDVNSTDNEVKVVLEMPGTKKEDIKIMLLMDLLKLQQITTGILKENIIKL